MSQQKKKYLNYDAVFELESTISGSLVQYIKDKINFLEKEEIQNSEQNQLILEKLHNVLKLNDCASLDWPAVKINGPHYYKYFNFIQKLLIDKKYEEARLLCILEIKGLNAYLNDHTKKYKYIWPQYIANNRWRKFCYNKHWMNDFKPFANLISDGIITLEQCAKYPFAFTVIVRLRPITIGYYKAVVECKKLSANQRIDMIRYLKAYPQNIPVSEYSNEEIYRIWLRSGSGIYRVLLPESDEFFLPPSGGFDFVYEAAKSRKLVLIKNDLKSCPRLFELGEKGVYPIEFIMAWDKSRKKYWIEFANWHNDDDKWKQNNCQLLKRRLKEMKLDPQSAFYFYVTMGHHTDATKLFHSLKKGCNGSDQAQEKLSSNTTSDSNLLTLPLEIIHVISQHLSLTSVMALTLTCKSINQAVNMNQEMFWKLSLSVTCPRSKFSTENSSWKEIAKKNSRTQLAWRTGKMLGKLQTEKYKDCFLMDENWAVFSAWTNEGRKCALYDCHANQLVDIAKVDVHLFLDSQPHIQPVLVSYSQNEIYIQKEGQLIQQTTPGHLYYGVGVGKDKIFFNDFIWDIETASKSMTFDLNQINYVGTKCYDEKNNRIMLSNLYGEFRMIDVRSGLAISKQMPLQYFDLIDDNTIGFVEDNGVGTMDLRMMQKEFIHSSEIYANTKKVLVCGVGNRAMIKRTDGLVIQWDFRERLWDRVFYQPRHLLAMNSRQVVTFQGGGLCVKDFSL